MFEAFPKSKGVYILFTGFLTMIAVQVVVQPVIITFENTLFDFIDLFSPVVEVTRALNDDRVEMDAADWLATLY